MSDVAAPFIGRPTALRLRISAIVAALLLLFGFVSIVWTPYPAGSFDIGAALQGPSAAHWLGADQLGRDLLSSIMRGTLTSFIVSAVAVAIGAIIGLPLGFAAARWIGPADRAIDGAGDFVLLFPALILAMLLGATIGPNFGNVMLAMGVVNIAVFMRVIRAALRALMPLDYVAAARLAGTGEIEIIRRHMLPELIPVIAAAALAQLAAGVLVEASLSFVGLGAQPPATSLGLILRDGQSYAQQAPVLLLAPGLVLIAIVLSLNAASSGLRERMTPLLRRIGVTDGAA
jgi:peptide/nickel transport system permease protein